MSGSERSCACCGASLHTRQERFCSRLCQQQGRRRPDLQTRLDAKTRYDPSTGCWYWLGSTTSGYGRVRAGGRDRLAHIVTYEIEVGPIPPGLELDHLCRQRSCRNPAHLEPVTRSINVLRGLGPTTTAALQRAKTHCPQGHAYIESNVRRSREGHRVCRTCHNAQQRDYMARRRGGQHARG